MRRWQRKFVALLISTVMSLSPLTGAFAIDAEPSSAMVDCQFVLAANAASGTADGDGADHRAECGQHQACTSHCQSAPLQPHGLPQLQTSRRPWFAPPGESENLVTRFLASIERPPRV